MVALRCRLGLGLAVGLSVATSLGTVTGLGAVAGLSAALGAGCAAGQAYAGDDGGHSQTDGATRDAAADAMNADAAAEDAPLADTAAADAPSADTAATDAPSADTAATDAPRTDTAATDAPRTDTAATDAPRTDTAATDSSVADGGTDGPPPDDSGCTVSGTTPDNCGPCGVVCPGYGQATAIVGCTPPDCTFACHGENYDSNTNPADGCEVADTSPGNHQQSTATYLGAFDCWDDDSAQNISGLLPTDARVHQDPDVAGFDTAFGGAPDWYRIDATGGAYCQNDIDLTLQVSGSATPACYQLRAITDLATYSCQASTSGACQLSPGIDSYSDGTVIYLVVTKTCATVVSEQVSYTVTGHL
jgi:hypothetical protein